MEFSIHKPSYTREQDDNTKHNHDHDHNYHGHTHDIMDNPGNFSHRSMPLKRNYKERAFTVGIGGPVGSGKTALLLKLCLNLFPRMNIAWFYILFDNIV
jgi:urease accessory protein